MTFTNYPLFINHRNGQTYPGHVVKFFENQTDTPKDIYTDVERSNAITQITLDRLGRSTQPLFPMGLYRIKVFTASNALVSGATPEYTEDDVGDFAGVVNDGLIDSNSSAFNVYSYSSLGILGAGSRRITAREPNYSGTTNPQSVTLDYKVSDGILDGNLVPGLPLEADLSGRMEMWSSVHNSNTGYTASFPRFDIAVYIRMLPREVEVEGGIEYYAQADLTRYGSDTETSSDFNRAILYSAASNTYDGYDSITDVESMHLSELSWVMPRVPRPLAQEGRVSQPLRVWKKGHPYEVRMRLFVPKAGISEANSVYMNSFGGQAVIQQFTTILKQYNANVSLTPEIQNQIASAQRSAQAAANSAAAAAQTLDQSGRTIVGPISTAGFVPYEINYKRNSTDTQSILEISRWGRFVGQSIIPQTGVLPEPVFFAPRVLTTNESLAQSFGEAFTAETARLIIRDDSASPVDEDVQEASGRFTISREGNASYVRIEDSDVTSQVTPNSGIPQGYVKYNGVVNNTAGSLDAINAGLVIAPSPGQEVLISATGQQITPVAEGQVRDVLLTPDTVEGTVSIDSVPQTTITIRTSDPDIKDTALDLSGNNVENLYEVSDDESITLTNTGVHQLEIFKEFYDFDYGGSDSLRGIVVKLNGVDLAERLGGDAENDYRSDTRFQNRNIKERYLFHTPEFKANAGDKITIFYRWIRAGGESIQIASDAAGSVKVVRFVNSPTSSIDSTANISTQTSKIIGTTLTGQAPVKISQAGWEFNTNNLSLENNELSSATTPDWIQVPVSGEYTITTYGFAAADTSRQYNLKSKLVVSADTLSSSTTATRVADEDSFLAVHKIYLEEGYGFRVSGWDTTDLNAVRGLTNGRAVIEISAPRVLNNIFKPNRVIDLADTPATYGTAGQVLRMNTAADAQEWATIAQLTGGVSDFIELDDVLFSTYTPNAILGIDPQGGGVVQVDRTTLMGSGGGSFNFGSLPVLPNSTIITDSFEVMVLATHPTNPARQFRVGIDKFIAETIDTATEKVPLDDGNEFAVLDGTPKTLKKTKYQDIWRDILGRSKLTEQADNLTYVLESLIGTKKLEGIALKNNVYDISIDGRGEAVVLKTDGNGAAQRLVLPTGGGSGGGTSSANTATLRVLDIDPTIRGISFSPFDLLWGGVDPDFDLSTLPETRLADFVVPEDKFISDDEEITSTIELNVSIQVLERGTTQNSLSQAKDNFEVGVWIEHIREGSVTRIATGTDERSNINKVQSDGTRGLASFNIVDFSISGSHALKRGDRIRCRAFGTSWNARMQGHLLSDQFTTNEVVVLYGASNISAAVGLPYATNEEAIAGQRTDILSNPANVAAQIAAAASGIPAGSITNDEIMEGTLRLSKFALFPDNIGQYISVNSQGRLSFVNAPTGGGGAATIPDGSIDNDALATDAVDNRVLAEDSVHAENIRNATIPLTKIQDAPQPGRVIVSDSNNRPGWGVPTTNIPDDFITKDMIKNGILSPTKWETNLAQANKALVLNSQGQLTYGDAPTGGGGGSEETIPASFLDQFDGADDRGSNTIVGATETKIIAFNTGQDDGATLGLSHSSGRLTFGDTHTDEGTLLAVNGKIRVEHTGLGGLGRVQIREYSAANALVSTITISEHPIRAIAVDGDSVSFDLPITETQLEVYRNRTYDVIITFVPAAAPSDGGTYGRTGALHLDNDSPNNDGYISFRRISVADVVAAKSITLDKWADGQPGAIIQYDDNRRPVETTASGLYSFAQVQSSVKLASPANVVFVGANTILDLDETANTIEDGANLGLSVDDNEISNNVSNPFNVSVLGNIPIINTGVNKNLRLDIRTLDTDGNVISRDNIYQGDILGSASGERVNIGLSGTSLLLRNDRQYDIVGDVSADTDILSNFVYNLFPSPLYTGWYFIAGSDRWIIMTDRGGSYVGVDLTEKTLSFVNKRFNLLRQNRTPTGFIKGDNFYSILGSEVIGWSILTGNALTENSPVSLTGDIVTSQGYTNPADTPLTSGFPTIGQGYDNRFYVQSGSYWYVLDTDDYSTTIVPNSNNYDPRSYKDYLNVSENKIYKITGSVTPTITSYNLDGTGAQTQTLSNIASNGDVLFTNNINNQSFVDNDGYFYVIGAMRPSTRTNFNDRQWEYTKIYRIRADNNISSSQWGFVGEFRDPQGVPDKFGFTSANGYQPSGLGTSFTNRSGIGPKINNTDPKYNNDRVIYYGSYTDWPSTATPLGFARFNNTGNLSFDYPSVSDNNRIRFVIAPDSIPLGGNQYDVLTKNTDRDHDVIWRDAGFTSVNQLPDANTLELGNKFYLTQTYGGLLPGGYVVRGNPDLHKNRATFTIAANSRATNVFGAQLTDDFSYGSVETLALPLTNKIAWDTQTSGADYFQIYINEEYAANNTYLRATLTNKSGTARSFRFIRETQSNEDTYNGVRYRRYGANPSLTPAELTFLRGIAADDDLIVDYYFDDNTRLNYKVEKVWGRLNDKNYIKNEVETGTPIISGLHALEDFNRLELFPTLAAATTAGVLNRPGYIFGIQSVNTQGTRITIQPQIIIPGRPATGGTAGATSTRNVLRLNLFESVGGDTQHYWDIQNRSGSKILTGYNSGSVNPTADQINENDDIGGVFFRDPSGGAHGDIEVWVKQGVLTQDIFYLHISNRLQGIGSTTRPEYTERLDKVTNSPTGDVVNIRGVLYDRYLRDTLTDDFEFENDQVFLSFSTDLSNNRPININADATVFSTGSGYVDPTGAIAARAAAFGSAL